MANGEITYSNPGGEMNSKALASGKYTGLATANIDIICGFTPSKIEIWNETDGYGFEWFTGITQGSMLQTVGSTGVKTLETITGAPVPLTKALSEAGQGFRVPLGTTTVINTTADDCYWAAWR